jgi:hypothetical protein
MPNQVNASQGHGFSRAANSRNESQALKAAEKLLSCNKGTASAVPQIAEMKARL